MSHFFPYAPKVFTDFLSEITTSKKKTKRPKQNKNNPKRGDFSDTSQINDVP